MEKEHGSKCTTEKAPYDIFFRGDEILIGNQPGTCERALYECDLTYAKNLQSVVKYYLDEICEYYLNEKILQFLNELSLTGL